jgi:predicted DNA-binding transcriptional regulator AlpA
VQVAVVQSALTASLANGAGEAPAATAPEPDTMLTIQEAAQRLRRSTKWLYRRARTLPFARRVGRSLVFSRAGLEKWVAKQRV